MAPVSGDRISLISAFTPASLTRCWQSVPHPTQPILATCSSDKTVRIYSLTSFAQLSTISGGHKRSIRTCAWKPGRAGTRVLATGSFDASVGLWRHAADDADASADDDGDPAATDFTTESVGGGRSGASAVHDRTSDDDDDDEEWRFALVLDGHDSEVKSVAWATGGHLLATCARDKSVWVWEEVGPDDYETVAVLQEHAGDVKCVAWHPAEELLASGAYDDDVRLWRETPDDWECVALLTGHAGTVWTVAWEAEMSVAPVPSADPPAADEAAWCHRRAAAGPRLASGADDGSIRIWRRNPRPAPAPAAATPSIIRTDAHREDWFVEATLPRMHARAIYAVAWSARSGRLVSTGDDGRVVVYGERWRHGVDGAAAPGEDKPAMAAATTADGDAPRPESDVTNGLDVPAATEWVVLAVLDGAHAEYEVNHVTWAQRTDAGRTDSAEEMLVTTGDDGVVKAWAVRT